MRSSSWQEAKIPGIYVNDGGATANSLGDILGGIANELSPAGRARALLLNEQTENADRSNWLKSAIQRGVLDVPGALGVMQADPGGGGGVAGTVASMAQPPGSDPMAPGARDPTRNASPLAGVIAGSYANNPDMSNFQTGVNLGRTANLGPGHGYDTQNEVAKANMMPYDLVAGTDRHFPTAFGMTQPYGGAGGPGSDVGGGYKTGAGPAAAGAGGTVVHGPSSYDQDVAKTMATAAPADAKHDIDVGGDATVNLGKAQAIKKIYETTVAPEFTPGGILTEKAAENLAAYFNLPVADILKMGAPGAKKMIRTQFMSMVSNLRDNLGQPMFKGGLPQIEAQFPDPDASPEAFRAAMETLTTTLQQQAADGDAAEKWYANPSQEAYVALLHKKSLNAAAARAAFATIGIHDTARSGEGEGSGSGAGDGGDGANGGDLPTVNTPEEARKLPKGTRFRMPGGRIGTSPGPKVQ